MRIGLAILVALVTAVLIYSVFGWVFSYFFWSFPTIPTWLMYVLPILFVPALCLFLYLKFFDPTNYKGFISNFVNTYLGPIGIGILLGSILIGNLNDVSMESQLVIDNATTKKAVVDYTTRKGKTKTVELAPDSHTAVSLPIGYNEVKVNGRFREIFVGSGAKKYILNVDSASNYYISIIYTGENSLIVPPMINDSLIKGEFIQIDADYLFDIPEADRNKNSEMLTKTLLIRAK